MNPQSQRTANQLLASLHRYPVVQRGLSAILEQVAARKDASLFIQGSIANGTMDPYSDVDLVMVIDRSLSLPEERQWLTGIMSSLGPLVAHFPASHLGMDNLLIFFINMQGDVLKVDVKVESLDTFQEGPAAKALHLSERMLTQPRSDSGFESPIPDFEDIHQKFVGWIWYTYTKITRGELFEAVDSMDIMRSKGILPCLHFTAKVPAEGYRRLETRLPKKLVQELCSSYPTSFEPRELARALTAMSRMFRSLQPELRKPLGRDHQKGDLDWMIAKLEKEQKELP